MAAGLTVCCICCICWFRPTVVTVTTDWSQLSNCPCCRKYLPGPDESQWGLAVAAHECIARLTCTESLSYVVVLSQQAGPALLLLPPAKHSNLAAAVVLNWLDLALRACRAAVWVHAYSVVALHCSWAAYVTADQADGPPGASICTLLSDSTVVC